MTRSRLLSRIHAAMTGQPRHLVLSRAALARLVLELDDLPSTSEPPNQIARRWPRIFGMTWSVDDALRDDFRLEVS